jgi:hypothetical protein
MLNSKKTTADLSAEAFSFFTFLCECGFIRRSIQLHSVECEGGQIETSFLYKEGRLCPFLKKVIA